MDNILDYIKSVEEPNLWLTVLNIGLLIAALVGVSVIVVGLFVIIRDYLQTRKGKDALNG